MYVYTFLYISYSFWAIFECLPADIYQPQNKLACLKNYIDSGCALMGLPET